jgi:serine/threonine protein phosphatase 1
VFKTYLFKSKGNNLKIEDLEKSLNTPARVMELARVPEVADIPVRK